MDVLLTPHWIHRLFLIIDNDSENCKDSDKHSSNCPGWAKTGECESNPAFMTEQCKKSCGKCGAEASGNVLWCSIKSLWVLLYEAKVPTSDGYITI